MKKVLHLNYGRPTPDSEPDGDSIQYFEIETFRLIHGYIYITPKGGEIHKDEITLTMISGCCYYDGIYYSDVWVETLDEIDEKYLTEYDAEKSIAPEEVVRKFKVDSLIYQLNNMDKDGAVDGDRMQQIIDGTQMSEQMLRQLVLSMPTKHTEELLAEKKELDEMNARIKRKKALESLSKEQLVKRLSFIEGDAKELRNLLVKSGTDMEFVDDNAPINTILSNIEIASNIEDSEPEDQDWKS